MRLKLAICAILTICFFVACKKEKVETPKKVDSIEVKDAAIIGENDSTNTTEEADTTRQKITLGLNKNPIYIPKIQPNLHPINPSPVKEAQKQWEKKQKEELRKQLDQMQAQVNSIADNSEKLTPQQIDQRLENYEYLISSVKNFSDIGIPPTHSHAANFQKNYHDVTEKAYVAIPFMNTKQMARFNKITKDLDKAMVEWVQKTSKKTENKEEQ